MGSYLFVVEGIMEKIGLVLGAIGIGIIVLLVVMIVKGEFNEVMSDNPAGWSESRTSTTKKNIPSVRGRSKK